MPTNHNIQVPIIHGTPAHLVLEEVVVQVALKAARKQDAGRLPLDAVGEGQRSAAHNGLGALRGEIDLDDLQGRDSMRLI